MSTIVLCQGCGQGVRIPKGHAKPKLRCPECGVVFTVAAAASASGISDEPLPPIRTKKAAEGYDEDESYNVPETSEKKVPCPKCDELIGESAIVCAHCGYNQETGETHERTYKAIDKEWEAGLTLPVRVLIFGCVGLVAFFASAIVAL